MAAAPTEEEIQKLRETHGRIEVVTGKGGAWVVVYRKPTRAEYKRFRAMSHRPEAVADAQEALARSCAVFPAKAEYDALLEDYPAIPEASGKALGDLAGISAEETGKD